MSTVGNRIKEAMTIRGLKQVDLVQRTGIGKSSICTYISGDYLPKQTNLYKIAKALSVDPAWLMGENVPMESIALPKKNLPANVLPIARKRIPLLGGIAAGQPIFAEEEHEAYVSVDENLQCDFALRVEGKSMEPGLHDGDIVFIRQQDDVDDGRIAAVLVDDSATLKRVTHIKGGLRLIGDNPSVFLPTDYLAKDYDNLRILGLAVAFHRKI